MKWDQQRPAKAAAERCPGSASTSPPQELLLLPSHIPTGRGAVGRTARRAEWWISQSRKTHFGAFCKKWAREHAGEPFRATEPAESAGCQQCRAGAPEPAGIPALRYTHTVVSRPPSPPCPLPSHIPTGRGAVVATARRAGGWISQSRKTHLGAFCKKGAREHAGEQFRATDPAESAGCQRAVYPVPSALDRPPKAVYPGPPAQNRPPKPSTLDRPPKAVYPGPPTQNRPPRPSTLDRPPRTALPSRLPWTAHQNPSTLDRPPRTDPPTRLPWTARPAPAPNPSTLDRPPPTRLPCTAHPPASQAVYPGPPTRTGLPALPEISASIFDFERRTVMDFLAKTLAPSTLSL